MSAKKKDEQDQRIEELVNATADGVAAGVCGREWCELCGQEGSFSGFLGEFGHTMPRAALSARNAGRGHFAPRTVAPIHDSRRVDPRTQVPLLRGLRPGGTSSGAHPRGGSEVAVHLPEMPRPRPGKSSPEAVPGT